MVLTIETGEIAKSSADRSVALRQGLDTYGRLRRDIAILRAQAGKEKQISLRVDLNLEIRKKELELASTEGKLRMEDAQ